MTGLLFLCLLLGEQSNNTVSLLHIVLSEKILIFFHLWELRDYREYSKKSPQIRPEKDEFESFGML